MPAGSEVTRQLKDVVADSREHKGEQEPIGLGFEATFFLLLKGQRSPLVYKVRYLFEEK